MISKYVINNCSLFAGRIRWKEADSEWKYGVFPLFPTAPRKRSLSLSSYRGTKGGIFDPRVLPGLTRHPSLSEG